MNHFVCDGLAPGVVWLFGGVEWIVLGRSAGGSEIETSRATTGVKVKGYVTHKKCWAVEWSERIVAYESLSELLWEESI